MEKIVLDILSNHMRFTYEIVPPSDILSSGYLQRNGSWTGTTGQLQRREVDMCVTWGAPSLAKTSVMDVSYPVVYVDSSIMIPFPRQKRLTLRNQASTFRMTLFVSVFGVFIITNYYTASYTSMLSSPNFKPIVNSIEDLATSDSVKTLLIKGSSTDEYIMSSTDPTLKKISDQMRRYPERRILDAYTVEDISTVVKEDSALIIVKSNGESLIEQSYKINKKCRVTLAEKTFFSRQQTFSYPKKSPIAKEIDYDLLLLHQAGLIQYAEKRAQMGHNPCRISDMKKAQSEKIAPLKLRNQMSAAFVFLSIGFGLGVLVFIGELIAAKIKKKSRIISGSVTVN
ncbi:hypothetical protein DAPPUDRAFT_240814 [Daphnia pulex]|uniref:Ionotropic glutamate receptor L-glutamate and glycine-binding domain-containing protein n=1 Tax=Daphnia pulex TaxID=6669 RepID=E9GCM7_DAPPU|nr:hypothetical protein DAPPUDRAFT_240814 [Daphnia pulex]|eukprot:EFX82837.1 hypothetical protein DAPPUDRAFT_240814 [Daphnia pulex]